MQIIIPTLDIPKRSKDWNYVKRKKETDHHDWERTWSNLRARRKAKEKRKLCDENAWKDFQTLLQLTTFLEEKKNGSFESTEDEFPRQKQMITSLIYDNTLLLFVCGLCIKVNGNFWKYNIRFRLTLQLLVKFFFVKNSRSDISLETKLQQTLKKYILWFVILSVK